jgi:hypothetical protein
VHPGCGCIQPRRKEPDAAKTQTPDAAWTAQRLAPGWEAGRQADGHSGVTEAGGAGCPPLWPGEALPISSKLSPRGASPHRHSPAPMFPGHGTRYVAWTLMQTDRRGTHISRRTTAKKRHGQGQGAGAPEPHDPAPNPTAGSQPRRGRPKLVRVFIRDGTFCPAFQVLAGGRLNTAVTALFNRAMELKIPHNYFTAWMVTPTTNLAGARPIDVLERQELLLNGLESLGRQ